MVSVGLSVENIEKLINFRLNPLSSEGSFSDLMASFNTKDNDTNILKLKDKIANLDEEINDYNNKINELKSIKSIQESNKIDENKQCLVESKQSACVNESFKSNMFRDRGVSVSYVLDCKKKRENGINDSKSYTNRGVSVSHVLKEKYLKGSEDKECEATDKNFVKGGISNLEYSKKGISVSEVLANKDYRNKEAGFAHQENSVKYVNKGISISNVLNNKYDRESIEGSSKDTLEDDVESLSINDLLDSWLEEGSESDNEQEEVVENTPVEFEKAEKIEKDVLDGLNDLFKENEDNVSEENDMWVDLAKKSNISTDSLMLGQDNHDGSKDIVDTPKDIRDFIRRNPGVTLEYAMRFYTKKEIETNLAKGRIFKKRGKLMI